MSDNVGKQQIKAFAERLSRMEEEKDALVSDISEIKAEAKANGFTVRALVAAVKKFRMTPEKREQAEQLELEIGLYYDAIQGSEE
jgi:uncharacterized protein (UPF0335 family)